MKLGRTLLGNLGEIAFGLGGIAAGVIVQVQGSSGATPDTTLLVTGGFLVALGGVLLSWLASRLLGEKQAEEAVTAARGEVDEKLDNLSRVLGQSAGQIRRAVEQAERKEIPALTGFALVSQAASMIYGQVNEIAVIRKTQYDSALLLDTVEKLDSLARELSPGTTIDEVKRQIQDVQANLSSTVGGSRSYSAVIVACPYCHIENTATLGSFPGDTAAKTCRQCGEAFNVHRSANGTAFSRPRRAADILDVGEESNARPVERWGFECANCGHHLGAAKDGKGSRVMICTNCLAAIDVDPNIEEATGRGRFELLTDVPFRINGSRPKFTCPKCAKVVKAALNTAQGYLAICTEDLVALRVGYDEYEKLKDNGG